MVMDQGNLQIEDKGLKSTITWEFANLQKSTELHLNQFVDFISHSSFFTCANSESWQNSRSIAVLHDSLA